MSDEPSYQDLIDMIGTTINNVDANSKREADKLTDDITLLRGELNDTRRDMTLMRSEMNTFRVEMSDMRGKLECDMIKSDTAQQSEIALIKQEGKLLGDRKAQLVGAIVGIISIISAIVFKLFGII